MINTNYVRKWISPEYHWCKTPREVIFCIEKGIDVPQICPNRGCSNPSPFYKKSYHSCSVTCGSKMSGPDAKQTKLERYGDENYNNRAKSKETKIERYGDENYNNMDQNKLTCLDRYGVDNILKFKPMRVQIHRTNVKIGRYVSLDSKTDFEIYKKRVWYYTDYNDLTTLDNYNMRGREDMVDDPYNLDHRFSIIEGFKKCILPHHIGSIQNLEMIPAHKNKQKSYKSSITIDELFMD